MAKRVKVAVRWVKGSGLWEVYESGRSIWAEARKEDAVQWARTYCSASWNRHKVPCELYLYNKNGKLGKGSRSRSTYGNDPRRTKG